MGEQGNVARTLVHNVSQFISFHFLVNSGCCFFSCFSFCFDVSARYFEMFVFAFRIRYVSIRLQSKGTFISISPHKHSNSCSRIHYISTERIVNNNYKNITEWERERVRAGEREILLFTAVSKYFSLL